MKEQGYVDGAKLESIWITHLKQKYNIFCIIFNNVFVTKLYNNGNNPNILADNYVADEYPIKLL